MVPDLRIPRKDSEGNFYEVYFSDVTIKMIADKKVMKISQQNMDLGIYPLVRGLSPCVVPKHLKVIKFGTW